MKPLLDTGMSEGKASFVDMINIVKETQSDIRKNFLALSKMTQ